MATHRQAAAFLLAGALAVGAAGPGASAAERDELTPAARQELARLVEALDSGDFSARSRAEEQLDRFLARQGKSVPLAGEVQRLLLKPDLSFEVRSQLQERLKALPAPPSLPADGAVAAEIGRLLLDLDSPSQARRLGARRRLEWLLESPPLAYETMTRAKQLRVEPSLSASLRRELEGIWREARGAWLLGNSADDSLPPVSDEQIAEQIARLAGDAEPVDQAVERQRGAADELLDLLAREDVMPRVKRQLEEKLPRVSETARTRLSNVLDWTRAAMAAEVWSGGKQLTLQHLLLGVPQYPEGLPPDPTGKRRASHFDRIDDRMAHCVSGVTLTGGQDYPVGVAFPHPERNDTFFHLVNLPTPRRRMAYEFHVQRDERTRLAELTRRTLTRYVEEKRALVEAEIMLWEQLDPRVASELAGQYFQAVDDRPLPESGNQRLGYATVHTLLCYVMAETGTREAIAGIERAAAGKRISEPSREAPYAMPWIAMLAIAQRDPWPDVDRWLLSMVPNDLPLKVDEEPAPTLGATAAAMLLRRNHVPAEGEELETVGEPFLERLGLPPRRFANATGGRTFVERWKDRRLPGGDVVE